MKIVCISDTHNLHHKIAMPDGDIVIHAGDATMRGREHETESFLLWFSRLPYRLKLFVPGNHDFGFDRARSVESLHKSVMAQLKQYPEITYLRDRVYYDEVSGLTFYGTPWVSGLEQWAFGWKSPEGREAEFMAIPPDTNVLVTHGPAYGKLDTVHGFKLGDEVLAERILQLPNLKLHVHGHIHDSRGVIMPPEGATGLITVNAACCTESYSCSNAPIVIEL